MQPIACSLNPADVRDRAQEWAALLERARARRVRVPGGVRIELRRDAGRAAELDRLVAAERACCAFMTMEIESAGDSIALTVTTPAEARPLLDELFGSIPLAAT